MPWRKVHWFIRTWLVLVMVTLSIDGLQLLLNPLGYQTVAYAGTEFLPKWAWGLVFLASAVALGVGLVSGHWSAMYAGLWGTVFVHTVFAVSILLACISGEVRAWGAVPRWGAFVVMSFALLRVPWSPTVWKLSAMMRGRGAVATGN